MVEIARSRDETLLWIELKSDKGRMKPPQIVWRRALQRAGERHYVFYPRDWRMLRLLLIGGSDADWAAELQRRFDTRHLDPL